MASLIPFTRLTTPLGKPTASNNSTTLCIVSGTFSLGFNMIVFPHTSTIRSVQ